MSYRVLCDEHVDLQTVQYLEREGHEAIHVRDTLDPGVDDVEIAAYARENGYIVLTNDSDFLDEERHPDITVFFYPNHRASAYELATMIATLADYYPTGEDLPREFYLTEENL